MKKIVIHCASGIRNTGDEAILDVVLESFRDVCEVTVISLDAAYSEKMHPGVRFIDNGNPAWRTAIKECDLFLLGGGGLIQDTTTFFNVTRWLTKFKYALRCGKKTMIYANSLEPLKYRWNRRIVKKYLQQADVITVRDKASQAIAEQLGIRGVAVTADPVYSYRTKAAEFPEGLPEEYVVMTIRHWYDTHPFIPVKICSRLGIRSRGNKERYEAYIGRLAEIAEHINTGKNLPVVWLSCCYNRDAKVAENVIARLSRPEMNHIVNEEYMSPSEAMAVIEKARLLLGMRLHGFIYAFLKKTPVIMLSYQEKVRGMAQMAGTTDVCFSIDDFRPEQVEACIEKLLREPESQTKKTEAFVNAMHAMQQANREKGLELLGEKNE